MSGWHQEYGDSTEAKRQKPPESELPSCVNLDLSATTQPELLAVLTTVPAGGCVRVEARDCVLATEHYMQTEHAELDDWLESFRPEGWTYKKLRRVLNMAGFVDLVNISPLLEDPRDVGLTAIKPEED
jgi:hypothetical protein